MKNLFLVVVSLFFGLKVFAATAESPKTFAYVDLELAMKTVKDGERAMQKLQKELKEKQELLQKKEADLKKLSEEFEKKKLVYSEDKKIKKQQEFQKRYLELQELYKQTQMSWQQRQMEITKPIVDSLRSVVNEVAQKDKIDFVYEKNTGGVLFAKNAKDITNKIVERYNQIHK